MMIEEELRKEATSTVEWEKPMYKIYTNGGKRKNGDNCFDFNIHFWKFHFWYINSDLQKKRRKK